MSDPLFVRVSYEWGNPYTSPSEGQPRVLAEVYFRYKEYPHKTPPEIEAVWKPGSGYAQYVTFLNEPPKQLNQEQLSNIRVKRLRRRVEKKYPLFADQIVSEEITANSEYYAGITRADLQAAHDGIVSEERAKIEKVRQMIEAKEATH
ncbi:MAG: hypothetical protein IMZ62_04290 [Chloroflexi bacterium]|nr:hypothetical protein [Chloroflexota bacterium]